VRDRCERRASTRATEFAGATAAAVGAGTALLVGSGARFEHAGNDQELAHTTSTNPQ
jgi:hypothetical protein